jgi:hypothetical protein
MQILKKISAESLTAPWQKSAITKSIFSANNQKGFNPCIRGLGGVVWWKKNRGRKSSVRFNLGVLAYFVLKQTWWNILHALGTVKKHIQLVTFELLYLYWQSCHCTLLENTNYIIYESLKSCVKVTLWAGNWVDRQLTVARNLLPDLTILASQLIIEFSIFSQYLIF